jgi:hypothetical protein
MTTTSSGFPTSSVLRLGNKLSARIMDQPSPRA